MPSRVKLRLEIVRQGKVIRELEDSLKYAEGGRRELERISADMREKYTALMTQFQRLDREYGKLAEMWNAF